MIETLPAVFWRAQNFLGAPSTLQTATFHRVVQNSRPNRRRGRLRTNIGTALEPCAKAGIQANIGVTVGDAHWDDPMKRKKERET
jgi:hypothetical protein